MAWFDSEPGVEARSGHGPATILGGERRSRPERRFASQGQNKRPGEEQPKTDALMIIILRLLDFRL